MSSSSNKDHKSPATDPLNERGDQLTATIFRSAPDAIIVMDEAGSILKWNLMAETLFGWKAEEVIGKPLSEIIIPAIYRRAHKEGLERFLKTGKANVLGKNIEIKALKKNEEEFDVSLNISPVKVEGRYIFIGFIRDISEIKKKEEEVNQGREIFSTLFYKSPTMNVISDAVSGRYIDVNDSYADFCGMKKEDMIGKTAMELGIISERQERLMAKVEKQDSVNGEIIKLKLKTGQEKWVSVNISRIQLNGRPCFISTMSDITMAKKGEEKFRSLLESAPDAKVIVNEKGIIQLINRQTERIFGYKRKEILGKHVEILMPSRYAGVHEVHRTDYYRNPKFRQMGTGLELLGKKKDGTEFPVEISLSPLETEEGLLVSAAIRDVTEKKELEKQIRDANTDLGKKVKLRTEELERKNKDLEQFAYVASHDLQEPLRTNSSFVEMLKERYTGKLDKDADTMLNFISQSSERMKMLIKDLLDYSRIGRKTVVETVDCHKIFTDVLADLIISIQETSAVIYADDLPVVRGYSTELKLLFQNLVSNAIKFRKKDMAPVIHISAKKEKDYWHFSVEDNGIGIEPHHRERIFVIFQRLHTRTEYEGSGIGLSNCKKIAELHGGKIWVDSEPGKGSVFHFTIHEM